MLFGRKSASKSAPPKREPASSAWYDAQFEVYADAAEGAIGPEGIERLCKSLEVDPTDVSILVLAWQLGASQMGYFSHGEWRSGASTLGPATSPGTLLERLQAVHASAQRNAAEMRDLHAFAHRFCREERKKNIDVASATAMLHLLHADTYPDVVPELIEFLEGHEGVGRRGVSQDEWAMTLQFCREIRPDLSDYQARQPSRPHPRTPTAPPLAPPSKLPPLATVPDPRPTGRTTARGLCFSTITSSGPEQSAARRTTHHDQRDARAS